MKNGIKQVTHVLMAQWIICCFMVILLHIKTMWRYKRNLATILPLKSKLSEKFQRFNAIDKSIKMLKKS